jgi:ankyrin repeat protein
MKKYGKGALPVIAVLALLTVWGCATYFRDAYQFNNAFANAKSTKEKEKLARNSKYNYNLNYALHEAAKAGRLDEVKILLQAGASATVYSKGDLLSEFENPPALLAAVYKGHKDIVAYMVDHGSNINIYEECFVTRHRQSNYRGTPLTLAFRRGNMEIAQLLIEKGADPNIRDSFGETALMYAAGSGKMDMVTALLEKGADPNIKNNNGWSALWYAVRNKNMVTALLEKGADPNSRDNDGWTALIFAANHGIMDMVKLLVENGANVNLRANNGSTALSLAYDKGEMDIYRYLKEQGAIEFEPKQAATPPVVVPVPSYAPPESFAPVPSVPAQAAPAAPSTVKLEPGKYTASGTNIKYSLGAGTVTLMEGYSALGNGTYRINGNTLVITFYQASGSAASLNGTTQTYTINNSKQFTGAGATWVWTGYM